MVDHLAGAGLADRVRQRRRAGDAKVGFEAVHELPPLCVNECCGMVSGWIWAVASVVYMTAYATPNHDPDGRRTCSSGSTGLPRGPARPRRRYRRAPWRTYLESHDTTPDLAFLAVGRSDHGRLSLDGRSIARREAGIRPDPDERIAMAILLDSSAVLAAADQSDLNHRAALAWFARVDEPLMIGALTLGGAGPAPPARTGAARHVRAAQVDLGRGHQGRGADDRGSGSRRRTDARDHRVPASPHGRGPGGDRGAAGRHQSGRIRASAHRDLSAPARAGAPARAIGSERNCGAGLQRQEVLDRDLPAFVGPNDSQSEARAFGTGRSWKPSVSSEGAARRRALADQHGQDDVVGLRRPRSHHFGDPAGVIRDLAQLGPIQTRPEQEGSLEVAGVRRDRLAQTVGRAERRRPWRVRKAGAEWVKQGRLRALVT